MIAHSLARRLTFPLVALLLLGASAYADTTVVPSAFTSTPGNLSYGFGGPVTFQQLWGSSTLIGIPPDSTITGIAFRLAPDISNSVAVHVDNFDISIGGSRFGVGSLSDSVSGNQASGTVKVRSGAVDFAADSFPGGNAINGFGPTIAFDLPYTYAGGDLLFTVSYDSPTVDLDFDAVTGMSDTDYLQASEYNATSLDQHFTGVTLVSQLQFTSAIVPENSTLLLLSSGLLICLLSPLRRWSAQ